MPRIVKQRQAEKDLLDIWLYTFSEWGEQQADDYLETLDAAIRLLAEQPLMCRERTEFTPPVRIHRHENHLVVYLAMDKGIKIIRILHASMDLPKKLE